MKLELSLAPKRGAQRKAPLRKVDVSRAGNLLTISEDHRTIEADARQIQPGLYSILIGGKSYEARVEQQKDAMHVHIAGREFVIDIADPRAWKGKRGGLLEAEGRQEIAAPMPGKIVRILVAQGAKVEAGQGLLVVEAMKMQNEIKSPKTGTVERLLVKEGQAVNAGESLAVVS
jgi:biotin carboxyl carrier protein